MSVTFSKYEFRLGMLSATDRGEIAVSFPIFAKDHPVKLVFNKCYINGNNGYDAAYIPKSKQCILINPQDVYVVNFSFSLRSIRQYIEGARLEIELLDKNDNLVVNANYFYESNHRWYLKEVLDFPLEKNERDEERIELEDALSNDDANEESWNVGIEEMKLTNRTYKCLKRAGVNKLSDLLTKTSEDIKCIRNIGEKGFEEILAKMSEYDVQFLEE